MLYNTASLRKVSDTQQKSLGYQTCFNDKLPISKAYSTYKRRSTKYQVDKPAGQLLVPSLMVSFED
jgi:hypothetical protein